MTLHVKTRKNGVSEAISTALVETTKADPASGPTGVRFCRGFNQHACVQRRCNAPEKARNALEKACNAGGGHTRPAYRRCTRDTRVQRPSPGPLGNAMHNARYRAHWLWRLCRFTAPV
jgi:hypothetical protein